MAMKNALNCCAKLNLAFSFKKEEEENKCRVVDVDRMKYGTNYKRNYT